jgi:hypothetical protein
VCVSMCVCECARARARACVCVTACVRVCVTAVLADGVGRGGASPGYVLVLNLRCSSSDHCNKLHALTAVLTGQQSSRLDLLFDSTLSLSTCAPALGHSSPRYSRPPTQGRGVWPCSVGRTVLCARRDICSATALTIIAELQRLDMFCSEISTHTHTL